MACDPMPTWPRSSLLSRQASHHSPKLARGAPSCATWCSSQAAAGRHASRMFLNSPRSPPVPWLACTFRRSSLSTSNGSDWTQALAEGAQLLSGICLPNPTSLWSLRSRDCLCRGVQAREFSTFSDCWAASHSSETGWKDHLAFAKSWYQPSLFARHGRANDHAPRSWLCFNC